MADRNRDNRGRGAIAGGFRPVRGLWEMLDWMARAWAGVGVLGVILAAMLLLARTHDANVDLLVGTVLVVVAVPLLKARGVPDMAAGAGLLAVILAIVLAFHGPIEEAIHGSVHHARGSAKTIADNQTPRDRDVPRRTSRRNAPAPKISHHESRNPAGTAVASTTSTKSRSGSSSAASGSPPASTTSGEEGAGKETQQSHTPVATHVQSPRQARVPHAEVEEAGEASPAKASPAVNVESAREPSHGPVIEN